MKKIRRKGKAEGSVLFTVVSVMMVMVVFLMSTLVLTTSANRRSYYTFYENQAQYTAQGVLDAISNYAYTNKEFHAWVTSLTKPGKVTVDISKSQIPVTKNGSQQAVTVQVDPTALNYIWDNETGTIRCQKGWTITVTASVGQGKNASECTMANHIYENYRNPVVSANQNRAEWYVTNPLKFESSLVNPGNPSAGTKNKANAMFTGSGASFTSGNNLLCLGPQTFGITRFPLGRGNYSSDTGVNKFTNQSITVGNGIFVGNFETNDKIYFDFQTAGEGVQFWGDFKVTNYTSVLSDLNVMPTEYRYLPYFYCDGNLQFHENTQAQIGGNSGKKTQPVNIYANQITNAPTSMMGDIYIFDPNADSNLHSNQDTALARFIGDNIQKTNSVPKGYVAGDIISNSRSLKIDRQPSIGGDIIFTNPNGTLTISDLTGKGTIGGAIVCAGNLVLNVGDKGLTVAGGIYADPTKTTITGSAGINGQTSLEAICDNVDKAPEPYHKADYTVIENSSTKAYIESLGMRGYTCAAGEGYSDLVNHLLHDHLGAQTNNTYYTDANYNGADYSLFPFCSRQDEIFTQYLRWDLAKATKAEAETAMAGDALVKESEACGHVWGAYEKQSASGTAWVPGTTPLGVTVIDSNQAKSQSKNCFIPPLETVSTASPGFTYENDYDTFISAAKYNITSSKTISGLQTKAVKFSSKSADGTDNDVDLGTVPVITDNCVLDITMSSNSPVNIFIDPTAKHNSSDPLAIVLKGSFTNNTLNFIVNNNCYYSSGAGGSNYSSYVTYAQKSFDDKTPIFAGRTDVLIFMHEDMYANKPFRIITTGSYWQIVRTRELDVISNPPYPGETQSDGTLKLSEHWASLYSSGSADAFKFEMVPNIVVYGQKGHDYSRGGDNPQLQNGSTFNAEVIMPDSIFTSPSGDREAYAKSVVYREFEDSVKYDAYKGDDKLIISLGTLFVENLNVKNVPLCVYLGDLGRPGVPPTYQIKANGLGTAKQSASNIIVGNNNDYFNNRYQSAG